ncbi:MAG: glycosyltransferase involved in cell wall biosynthesis [Rhodothermales bacterium]
MSARLLLFDLYTGGHHRTYLETLARAWVTGPERGLLEMAVSTAFAAEHPDFVRWMDVQDAGTVKLVPIALPEPLREGDMGLGDVLRQDLLHGRVLSRLLRERNPESVLAMYFDHLQASLALRRVKQPSGGRVPISGIYFRPSFHYQGEPLVTRFRKRTLLSAALANPAVNKILCLDPFAVEARDHAKLQWLPDGLDPSAVGEAARAVRERWGVPPDHKLLLFFGVVSARKGIHEVLAALRRLQTLSTLVIAGRIPAAERAAVEAAIAESRAEASVIHQDRYLRDEEVQDLMAAADVALVAYRHHIGSSHVLIRAAAAGTPVVGPAYGLMGKLIRENALGAAVDTDQPDELAREIDRMLDQAGHEASFDKDRALQFAELNNVEHFISTIFGAVLQ